MCRNVGMEPASQARSCTCTQAGAVEVRMGISVFKHLALSRLLDFEVAVTCFVRQSQYLNSI